MPRNNASAFHPRDLFRELLSEKQRYYIAIGKETDGLTMILLHLERSDDGERPLIRKIEDEDGGGGACFEGSDLPRDHFATIKEHYICGIRR